MKEIKNTSNSVIVVYVDGEEFILHPDATLKVTNDHTIVTGRVLDGQRARVNITVVEY